MATFLSQEQQQALAQLGGCLVLVLPNQQTPTTPASALAPADQQAQALRILAAAQQAQQTQQAQQQAALSTATGQKRTAATAFAAPAASAAAGAPIAAPAAKPTKWKAQKAFNMSSPAQPPAAAAGKASKPTKWKTATTLDSEGYESKMRPANSLLGPNASGPKKWASSIVFNERQHEELRRLQLLNAQLTPAQAMQAMQTQLMRAAAAPAIPVAPAVPLAPAVPAAMPAVAEAARTGAAVDGLLSLLGAAEGDATGAAEERMQPTGALARIAATAH